MKYMLLIYENESTDASQRSDAENDRILKEYFAFSAELLRRGINRGGDELGPTWTATTLRERDGVLSITDGPFAETKEHLGGYFILECTDLNEAIEVAKGCPAARYGSLELRPIVEHG